MDQIPLPKLTHGHRSSRKGRKVKQQVYTDLQSGVIHEFDGLEFDAVTFEGDFSAYFVGATIGSLSNREKEAYTA